MKQYEIIGKTLWSENEKINMSYVLVMEEK